MSSTLAIITSCSKSVFYMRRVKCIKVYHSKLKFSSSVLHILEFMVKNHFIDYVLTVYRKSRKVYQKTCKQQMNYVYIF